MHELSRLDGFPPWSPSLDKRVAIGSPVASAVLGVTIGDDWDVVIMPMFSVAAGVLGGIFFGWRGASSGAAAIPLLQAGYKLYKIVKK